MKYSSQSKINLIKKIIVHKQNIVLELVFKSVCVKFLQSHPPITETFRFCLIVYLYNMFQPSTGSSSGTNELNYQNDFSQFQKLIKHFKSVCSPKIFKVKGAGTFYKEAFWYYSILNVQSNNP